MATLPLHCRQERPNGEKMKSDRYGARESTGTKPANGFSSSSGVVMFQKGGEDVTERCNPSSQLGEAGQTP